MNAFLFPGQGSQSVGMGRVWCEQYPELNDYFDRASKVLSLDLRQLCFEGPQETLTQTENAQPALLTVGVICAEVARKRGLTAQMLAGHSLGEYTALVAGGVLEFEGAVELVRQRAALMAAAAPGAMAAIVGMKDEQVAEVVQTSSEEGILVAANFNAPGQVVISGEIPAVEAARQLAKSHGAKMTVLLPVSGAFHSPLMAPAAAKMEELINAAPFADAAIPIFQNTTAQPATKAGNLRAALIAQMTGAVRWSEIIANMIAGGASQFYELGPGSVLSGLCRRIDKSVKCETADSWTSG